MTDVEKRRIQLLDNTRKIYSSRYVPPAVHPRYQSTYHSLYEINKTEKKNSFGIRLLISILLFALIYTMHYQEKSFGIINDDLIINEIQKEYLFR